MLTTQIPLKPRLWGVLSRNKNMGTLPKQLNIGTNKGNYLIRSAQALGTVDLSKIKSVKTQLEVQELKNYLESLEGLKKILFCILQNFNDKRIAELYQACFLDPNFRYKPTKFRRKEIIDRLLSSPSAGEITRVLLEKNIEEYKYYTFVFKEENFEDKASFSLAGTFYLHFPPYKECAEVLFALADKPKRKRALALKVIIDYLDRFLGEFVYKDLNVRFLTAKTYSKKNGIWGERVKKKYEASNFIKFPFRKLGKGDPLYFNGNIVNPNNFQLDLKKRFSEKNINKEKTEKNLEEVK